MARCIVAGSSKPSQESGEGGVHFPCSCRQIAAKQSWENAFSFINGKNGKSSRFGKYAMRAWETSLIPPRHSSDIDISLMGFDCAAIAGCGSSHCVSASCDLTREPAFRKSKPWEMARIEPVAQTKTKYAPLQRLLDVSNTQRARKQSPNCLS
jgi:hypothetical protein